ncbi:MAG: acyl carrier protein [Lachnospiraceae bacterium]|nr:acyl carrier protein [Lachnospiraceae bacterium]
MEFEIIQQIVARIMGTEVDSIREDTSFADDLGADSLDIFQIIMAIEEQFEVEISDEDAQSIVTVGDAARQIIRLGGSKCGGERLQ